MRLEEMVSKPVVAIEIDAPVHEVMALMESRAIRHVPVMDRNRLVGIVSDRDLLSVVGTAAHDDATITDLLRVAHVMSSPVHTLTPEDGIDQAARLMLQEKIGAIPLLRDRQLVGIVTVTDFLIRFRYDRSFLHGAPWRSHGVGDYVRGSVYSVRAKDDVMEAFRLMCEKRIRHLPVVDESLVGIVSERDVRRHFADLIRDACGDDRGTKRCARIPDKTVIGHIMTTKVATIQSSATLAEAAGCMLAQRIGALPVTDAHNQLVGIITEMDLLLFVAVNEVDPKPLRTSPRNDDQRNETDHPSAGQDAPIFATAACSTSA